ncbi:efflux RND transporter permease subunit [Marinigracilibium pacificum]|uniref:Efflux RND transporter permease subunit n=1 Tax=Marinigracilibium pacificum TaxID=2729599 RepID=A0A848J3H4_9BACT|nr:efflux RND transporter permease subunit [Marinigracilibium pacificum]NMM50286.1 efflux RND transporter permease subunit [Marinigracilibium pacificum]
MASLSNISINRPVLAIVMSLMIIIFGIIGFNLLGIREYPSVDPPIITVSTNYIGANAEVIESQITEPLEEEINGISGIKKLTSVSRDGRSTVTVEFELGEDLEAAANDVRDRVSRARRNLPADADPPTVIKADADSEPIVFLNLKSDERSLLELSQIAENTFKERFQTIPGVSQVDIWGEKKYSMRLWMDPDKLSAFKITPLDVYSAVSEQNVELPSGRIEGLFSELSVRTLGRLTSPEDYNDLIIKETDNYIVKFRDIGYAELGPENERTILKRDGIPMVGVVLRPQPGSNNIEIIDEFYSRLESLRKDVPEDIELGIGFDVTKYIRESITEVEQTITVAFTLVFAIIFFFLRDWRTTIIPVITIPISLIGTFFIMYAAGFSINVLTLLGIVLAIGLVVDDTIVVLENIYKKIEDGKEPLEAGFEGAKEIFFAVISTTVALAAVFLPVIFLQGLTGRLFREFGVVVASSVIISSFVALTLAPMLCTKLLKKREEKGYFYKKTEKFFVGLNSLYNRSLEWFMGYRWIAILVLFGLVGVVYFLFTSLPSELAPYEDRNGFRIFASGPEGTTFEYMDNYVDEVIDLIQEEIPETDAIISVTSPGFGATSSVNSAFWRAILVDAEDRERSQQEIVDGITPEVSKLTAARPFVSQEQSIGGRGGGLPIQYVIQAGDVNQLKDVISDFVDKAKNRPEFVFVDTNLKFNKPELTVEIDRDKAQVLGVSVRDIAQTLSLAFSGQRFGYFIMEGKQYQIIGQMSEQNRNAPVDLRTLYIRNKRGELILLDNLIRVKEGATPPQLFRFNRYASATISAALAPGVTIDKGIAAMDEIKAELLDERYSTSLDGQSLEFMESSNSLYFAFLFALILIYLVLSAQFESFSDPITIIVTVPLAMAGALGALWLFGETLNIFSQIGIIMLIGLVTKNGILIVEFANQKKATGMSVKDSIIEAAEDRFRPILMTSLSTILGILPIALALGAGSESRVSMGIAVIGGMIFSTVLTLYIIPAIYTYLTSKEARVSRM